MAYSLALACSFAVYFSSQTKAIDWPVCVTASGHICRAPTAIMTGENRAMAQPYPNRTVNGRFGGADGGSGHQLTGKSDRRRALGVSSDGRLSSQGITNVPKESGQIWSNEGIYWLVALVDNVLSQRVSCRYQFSQRTASAASAAPAPLGAKIFRVR